MADNPSFPIATASFSWTDNTGVHIRVYSSDGYNVSERCYDQANGAWSDGEFKQAGSQVSATCWQSNGIYMRVYCTTEDKTTEYCNDAGGGGWYVGAYSTI